MEKSYTYLKRGELAGQKAVRTGNRELSDIVGDSVSMLSQTVVGFIAGNISRVMYGPTAYDHIDNIAALCFANYFFISSKTRPGDCITPSVISTAAYYAGVAAADYVINALQHSG